MLEFKTRIISDHCMLLFFFQSVGIVVSCYMCCTVKNDDEEDEEDEENEAHV